MQTIKTALVNLAQAFVIAMLFGGPMFAYILFVMEK